MSTLKDLESADNVTFNPQSIVPSSYQYFQVLIHSTLHPRNSASTSILFWIQKIYAYECMHLWEGWHICACRWPCTYMRGHPLVSFLYSSVNFLLLKPWAPWHGWTGYRLSLRTLAVSVPPVQLDFSCGLWERNSYSMSCLHNKHFTWTEIFLWSQKLFS